MQIDPNSPSEVKIVLPGNRTALKAGGNESVQCNSPCDKDTKFWFMQEKVVGIMKVKLK